MKGLKLTIYRIYLMGLKGIYFFMKLLPTNQKKIFFLSRQSNTTPLDFALLIKEIKEQYPDYKIVVSAKAITSANLMGHSIKDKFSYATIVFVHMYHLATSKVCVTDGYNLATCALNHKKNLFIVQLWHALGAIKKFGYQTLGRGDNASFEMAKLVKLHQHYDIIVAGSKATIPCFSEAFHQPKEKFVTCGLPRIDYLLKESEHNKQKILEAYPHLKKKKVILYVPTFRKHSNYYVDQLIENIDHNKYEFLMKGHPLKKKENNEITQQFTSLELLSVADYIITDYSAIAMEALVFDKPLYFYLYDLEEYEKTTGLNIDLQKEMPHSTFLTSKELIQSIESETYDFAEYQKFQKKYLDNKAGTATKELVSYIIGGKK